MSELKEIIWTIPKKLSLYMYDYYDYAEVIAAGCISCVECGSKLTPPQTLLGFFVPSVKGYVWIHACGKVWKIQYQENVDLAMFMTCLLTKQPQHNPGKFVKQFKDGKLYNELGPRICQKIDFLNVGLDR